MSDLASITQKIAATVGSDCGLGKTVKLNFGDEGSIYIDGASTPNVVSNKDDDADAVINISLDDLVSMAKGELDPMMAFMMGKMKIEGDMMLAQKLAPLLKG